MKPVSVLIFIVVLLSACKKDKDKDVEKARVPLLSNVYSNGFLANKFYYSPTNQLVRLEFFSEQAGNALVSSAVVEYDKDGNIGQLTTYNEPGHSAFSRTIIDSIKNGNIIQTSNYDLLGLTPGTPSAIQKRTYNAQGLMSKIDARDKNGKLIYIINISYYGDGSIKQTDQYKEESGALYPVAKKVFAIPGTLRSKGLEPLEQVLGYEYTAPFFNEAYQSFNYDQSGTTTFNRQYTMSAREYSADSTLTRQTITVKKVKPAGADDVIAKQYEYIIQ